jgi:hypothetical protein
VVAKLDDCDADDKDCASVDAPLTPKGKGSHKACPCSKRRTVVAPLDNNEDSTDKSASNVKQTSSNMDFSDKVSSDKGETRELVPVPNISTSSAVAQDILYMYYITLRKKNLGTRKCSVVITNTASQEKRLQQLMRAVARKLPRTPLSTI